ncbi:hypothetical protein DBY65_010280 [Pseudomonas sp. RIT412]|nr:hypothetical protein DBY65_010280 [Pseudomonas sp. RIT 412]
MQIDVELRRQFFVSALQISNIKVLSRFAFFQLRNLRTKKQYLSVQVKLDGSAQLTPVFFFEIVPLVDVL